MFVAEQDKIWEFPGDWKLEFWSFFVIECSQCTAGHRQQAALQEPVPQLELLAGRARPSKHAAGQNSEAAERGSLLVVLCVNTLVSPEITDQ